MATQPYTAPFLNGTAFHCPHCGAYANQYWFHELRGIREGAFGEPRKYWHVVICGHCQKEGIWGYGKMFFPMGGSAPLPNPDLPDQIRGDYEEAREISTRSPRGAAALLRLAIQKLCVVLGEDGRNINNDIASLVRKGLPVRVQQALDLVRVIGNDAVHPGMIDLKDDLDTVNSLFSLVNFIADKMISEPKHIESLYAGLPANKLEQIAKRDGN